MSITSDVFFEVSRDTPRAMAELWLAPCGCNPSVHPHPAGLGRLAHYEIGTILGRGAFGIVAKAHDEKLHCVVAIKMLGPNWPAVLRLASGSCAKPRGVGDRMIDDWDLGFHGLELAPFASMGYRPELRGHETRVTTYVQGPDRPRNWTGAFIRGSLLARMVDIPFEIRVGKGMSHSRKGLRLVDVDGRVRRSVSLDGTSEDPHYRMIRELMTAEQPNLVLTLPQVVDICRACEEAADVAREEERHRFGETPEWLRTTNPVLQTLS